MIIIDEDAKKVIGFRFSIFKTKEGKYAQVIELGGGFPPTAKIFDSVKEAFDDFSDLIKGYAESIPELEVMSEEEYKKITDKAEEIKKEMMQQITEEFKELQKGGKFKDVETRMISNVSGKKKDKVLN